MDKENKNNKIRLRHIAISILTLFNLWELWDIAGVTNAYWTLIGFFMVILPLAGSLFFTSFFAKDKDEGLLKKISVIGIVVSAITLSVSGLLVIYRLTQYYLFS